MTVREADWLARKERLEAHDVSGARTRRLAPWLLHALHEGRAARRALAAVRPILAQPPWFDPETCPPTELLAGAAEFRAAGLRARRQIGSVEAALRQGAHCIGALLGEADADSWSLARRLAGPRPEGYAADLIQAARLFDAAPREAEAAAGEARAVGVALLQLWGRWGHFAPWPERGECATFRRDSLAILSALVALAERAVEDAAPPPLRAPARVAVSVHRWLSRQRDALWDAAAHLRDRQQLFEAELGHRWRREGHLDAAEDIHGLRPRIVARAVHAEAERCALRERLASPRACASPGDVRLHGRAVRPGQAHGRVMGVGQVETGGVLVATRLHPGNLPLLPLAGAVVLGGALTDYPDALWLIRPDVPVVTGAGEAVRALQPGDTVAVDGARGLVRAVSS